MKALFGKVAFPLVFANEDRIVGRMTNVKEKLKVLCLHGYRQNAQGFREKTGAFRKIPIVKKYMDLVFITAPNVVPKIQTDEGIPEESSSSEDTGWWFSKEDSTYMAQEYTDCCEGYQESLELVEKTFQEQGPFDGVLSFSQGAAFASLLCGAQEQSSDFPLKFNFVILVAGFKSRQSTHQCLYSNQISIPSLHVYGDTDKVIPKEMSEDLLQHFSNPKILQHNGGHFIPAAGPQKPIYTEFLQAMLDRKFETS